MGVPRSGQSLVELLIAIAIGAIFMAGMAVTIVSSLSESGQAANVQTASTNAQSLLNNVRVWSEGNWNNILSLATGSTYQYYLVTSSSPYTATSGVESIAGATTTYTRYFYVSDVYRNGGSIAPTGAYDPSTKQISVVYGWTNGTTSTMSTYLTRNQNAAFDQADWSGGATSTVTTSTNNQFASSSKPELHHRPDWHPVLDAAESECRYGGTGSYKPGHKRFFRFFHPKILLRRCDIKLCDLRRPLPVDAGRRRFNRL